ncbi:putative glycosyltransferase [Celeribacter persicus]|uniref:Putative glycosyltransferase n=1 Tax=Celeribacter persicus TaxID=1651082 RepID=A0A2T5HSL5_9RHOB|nr:putative glycosyltransferase [Celeribacter persicus]
MPKDVIKKVQSAPAARVVIYSHDTLGYGHLRRNLALARKLRMLPDAPDVLMIAGMREAGAFDIPEGVDLVILPAYAKGRCGNYTSQHLSLELGQLAELRAGIIRAAVKSFRPDLVIVDNVPQGAQQELRPTLKWLRGEPARVVLGLRDVIDSREVVRRQWLRQRNVESLTRYYDEVWVYGDPEFYDLVEEYGFGPTIGAKVRFTGYLDRSGQERSATARQAGLNVLGRDRRPYILCSLGGGRDGLELGAAFAAARMPKGQRGILVTGSQMTREDRRAIIAIASANPDVEIVEFVPELAGLIDGAERIIGMGGYNTICEILSFAKTSLIVPRIRPRQEQLIRAERLANARMIDLLHPDALSPEAISDWLSRPTDAGRGGSPDLSGLDRFAELTSEALSAVRPTRIAA